MTSQLFRLKCITKDLCTIQRSTSLCSKNTAWISARDFSWTVPAKLCACPIGIHPSGQNSNERLSTTNGARIDGIRDRLSPRTDCRNQQHRICKYIDWPATEPVVSKAKALSMEVLLKMQLDWMKCRRPMFQFRECFRPPPHR